MKSHPDSIADNDKKAIRKKERVRRAGLLTKQANVLLS